MRKVAYFEEIKNKPPLRTIETTCLNGYKLAMKYNLNYPFLGISYNGVDIIECAKFYYEHGIKKFYYGFCGAYAVDEIALLYKAGYNVMGTVYVDDIMDNHTKLHSTRYALLIGRRRNV